MMTAKRQRSITGCVTAIAMGIALWISAAPAQAASVTQLDITGGSINLNFGALGSVSGTFTQNGQLVMGQYRLCRISSRRSLLRAIRFRFLPVTRRFLAFPAERRRRPARPPDSR